jgi:hypothetical protein
MVADRGAKNAYRKNFKRGVMAETGALAADHPDFIRHSRRMRVMSTSDPDRWTFFSTLFEEAVNRDARSHPSIYRELELRYVNNLFAQRVAKDMSADTVREEIASRTTPRLLQAREQSRQRVLQALEESKRSDRPEAAAVRTHP